MIFALPIRFVAVFAVLGLSVASACAGEVRAAVAANFTAPMQEIAPLFERASGHRLSLSFGSTGKFYAQIHNGAPFDVFLAADADTPRKLEAEALTAKGSRFVYALGKLALWSPQPGYVDGKGAVLRTGGFSRLAIGDPKLAPYGMAAQETLEKLGLWKSVQPRLVKGENITQTFQFVATGNAELGFVALSQVAGVKVVGSQTARDGKVGEGSYWLVPGIYYTPIEQGAVQLSAARDAAAAKAFLDFLKGPQAAAVISKYGYELPGK